MKAKILLVFSISSTAILVVAVITSSSVARESNGRPNAPAERANAPALERFDFIHYKKDSGKAKPSCNNNGICEPELGENPSCGDCKSEEDPVDPPSTTCYAFMGQYGKKLLKWRNRDLPLRYTINTTISTQYLDPYFILNAVSSAAEQWDEAEQWGFYRINELFDNNYDVAEVYYGNLDGCNAICFGNYYTDPDIIAVCSVWYNPATKTIEEFDITFETDYYWGDADFELGVMDLQNIATHELGHAFGLADVYEGCPEVTMHGYSGEGETKKRTVEEDDLIGSLILYPDP